MDKRFALTLLTVTLQKMNVLLVGHSFIRRLKRNLLPAAGGRDVTAQRAQLAATFASQLEVSQHFESIFTCSENLNLICHLEKCVATVTNTHPQVVMLDIGSNDLAHIKTKKNNICLQLASKITDFAKNLLTLGVRLVIINSVLPRTGRIACTPDVFASNCHAFNNYVKHFTQTETNIKYNKLRGFYGTDNPHQNPPTVNTWSTDGIHCNKGNSAKVYARRVRHGLLFFKHVAIKQ